VKQQVKFFLLFLIPLPHKIAYTKSLGDVVVFGICQKVNLRAFCGEEEATPPPPPATSK
jgi:hypothetical protein